MNYSTRNIEIKSNGKILINSNLHIKFTVVKSQLALPNSAKIEVFNIAPETFSKLLLSPNVDIFYDGKKIFKGKIINVDNPYYTPEYLCTIYANDIKNTPFETPQYLDIPKDTSNESAIKQIVELISEKEIDTTAFKNCKKASGSLVKQMIVEYKKEEDILKALQNLFKDCDTQVIKEDGKVKIQSKNKVPNPTRPLIFTELLEPPELSNVDIGFKVPINTKARLGVGFEVQSKTVVHKYDSEFLHKQQFKAKIFKITQLEHTADNHTEAIATTEIKGFKIV